MERETEKRGRGRKKEEVNERTESERKWEKEETERRTCAGGREGSRKGRGGRTASDNEWVDADGLKSF